jgi:hypothetical protein
MTVVIFFLDDWLITVGIVNNSSILCITYIGRRMKGKNILGFWKKNDGG